MDKKLDIEKKLEQMSQNEIDPRLHFDAFTAGVKDGGLRSSNSISLMVCYIIASVDRGVTIDVIRNALSEGMLANYFEVTDALAKLIEKGTVIEDENGILSLKNNNKSEIELIEKDLPYTVRVRSIRLVQKILSKETYRRDVNARIDKDGDAYMVSLAISDGDRDYLSLKLFAPTVDQAQMIKEKFITDPVSVYETLIDAIFANEE